MDKDKTAFDTVQSFFGQFGEDDVVTRIVLEELFKELYGENTTEAVPVHGTPGQKGNESAMHIPAPSVRPEKSPES